MLFANTVHISFKNLILMYTIELMGDTSVHNSIENMIEYKCKQWKTWISWDSLYTFVLKLGCEFVQWYSIVHNCLLSRFLPADMIRMCAIKFNCVHSYMILHNRMLSLFVTTYTYFHLYLDIRSAMFYDDPEFNVSSFIFTDTPMHIKQCTVSSRIWHIQRVWQSQISVHIKGCFTKNICV
jgi:hypothetical protein